MDEHDQHSEWDDRNNRFSVMVGGTEGTDEHGQTFSQVRQPVDFDSFWMAGNSKAGYFLIRATSTLLYFRADASNSTSAVALISKQEYDYDARYHS